MKRLLLPLLLLLLPLLLGFSVPAIAHNEANGCCSTHCDDNRDDNREDNFWSEMDWDVID